MSSYISGMVKSLSRHWRDYGDYSFLPKINSPAEGRVENGFRIQYLFNSQLHENEINSNLKHGIHIEARISASPACSAGCLLFLWHLGFRGMMIGAYRALRFSGRIYSPAEFAKNAEGREENGFRIQ